MKRFRRGAQVKSESTTGPDESPAAEAGAEAEAEPSDPALEPELPAGEADAEAELPAGTSEAELPEGPTDSEAALPAANSEAELPEGEPEAALPDGTPDMAGSGETPAVDEVDVAEVATLAAQAAAVAASAASTAAPATARSERVKVVTLDDEAAPSEPASTSAAEAEVATAADPPVTEAEVVAVADVAEPEPAAVAVARIGAVGQTSPTEAAGEGATRKPVPPPPRPPLPDLPAKPPRQSGPVSSTGSARTRWLTPEGSWETTLRGRQLMADPRLYRGVAFAEEERRQLGLVGLLPPQVVPLHEQLTRALGQYRAQPTDLARNVYLSLLQDRNEVLFFRLLSENLAEMMPVVYTPTVGEAIQHFSQEYRRPRGVFLSVDHPEDLEVSLTATGLAPEDVDLIVATDGEALLGIGDWGVGGISISVGKLALYTAAGGIDPGRALAVMLDVGTNRQSLLEDPLYLGNRHPRVDDATYDSFVDSFVETASRLFPNALLHWEDLAARNARRILQRWGDSAFTFNDDVQGTGAVVLAAVLSGLKRSKVSLSEQRVVIFGAGTAGVGVAERMFAALVADGLSEEEARRRFWLIGRNGLLVESMGESLADYQRPWARPDADVADWMPDDHGWISLGEVIRNVAATVLVGTSGQAHAFTEQIIRNMALSCQNPIILPLSNPTALVEAEPWDIMQWTGGRALVATGSHFDPVTYAWSTHYIGQANNAFIFPGLGLGAILVGATRVTDHMLAAAAESVSAQVDMSIEGAPLLPEIEALRATSAAVALAVGIAAIEDGVARWALPDVDAGIEAAMWRPEYLPIRAV